MNSFKQEKARNNNIVYKSIGFEPSHQEAVLCKRLLR